MPTHLAMMKTLLENQILLQAIKNYLSILSDLHLDLVQNVERKEIEKYCQSLSIETPFVKKTLQDFSNRFQGLQLQVNRPYIFNKPNALHQELINLHTAIESWISNYLRLSLALRCGLVEDFDKTQLRQRVIKIRNLERKIDKAPYPEQYPSYRGPSQLHSLLCSLNRHQEIDYGVFETAFETQLEKAFHDALSHHLERFCAAKNYHQRQGLMNEQIKDLNAFKTICHALFKTLASYHHINSDKVSKTMQALSANLETLYSYRPVLMKSKHRGTAATPSREYISDWSDVDGYIPPENRPFDPVLSHDDIKEIRQQNRHWFVFGAPPPNSPPLEREPSTASQGMRKH